MSTIIISLISLSIIIMFHEIGHFIMARITGICVEEFSIGMGPRLFKFSGKETVYSLRAVLIGGYVKFLGEDEESDDPRAFTNAKLWKRMCVVLAGPLMNFVLAALLLSISFMVFGIYVPAPVIMEVYEGTPAEKVGLQPGDKVIEIEGISLKDRNEEEAVEQIRSVITGAGSRTIELTVKRDNQNLHFSITPEYDNELQSYKIGVAFGEVRRLNLFSAVGMSFVQTGKIVVLMITMLGKLIFQGRLIAEVMGPVGIVAEMGKAVRAGIQYLINLGVIITINLGIINLIPFPALDGGRVALMIVEGIRGKALDREKEGYIHLIGFVLLMFLLLVVTLKDISR